MYSLKFSYNNKLMLKFKWMTETVFVEIKKHFTIQKILEMM